MIRMQAGSACHCCMARVGRQHLNVLRVHVIAKLHSYRNGPAKPMLAPIRNAQAGIKAEALKLTCSEAHQGQATAAVRQAQLHVKQKERQELQATLQQASSLHRPVPGAPAGSL